MSDEGAAGPGAGGPLQFEQAELGPETSSRSCAACKTAITDAYFAVGPSVVCSACGDKLSGKAGGRGVLLRAWVRGGGVAVIGTIVWYAIARITNMELGIVAVVIGYAVGRAVQRASYGRGGWKYQALAMFLTYASIVTSYVPEVIKTFAKLAEKDRTAELAKEVGKPDDGTPEAAARIREAKQARAERDRPKLTAGGFALFFLVTFGVAFAAPFLGGTSNIMGLIIIGIALYEAWKLNKRVPITGPFRLGAAPVAAVPELA